METIMINIDDSLVNIKIEQEKIYEQVKQVENKRHSILAYIKDLKVENKSKIMDKMQEKCTNLEIKLNKKEEIPHKDPQTKSKKRKCNFQNRGFCKLQKECEFSHSEKICEVYLKDGKCQKNGCLERHPKDCHYWIKKEVGCTREGTCMYLHCPEKRFQYGNDKKKDEEIDVYTCDKCNFTCKIEDTFIYHVKSNHETKETEKANTNLEKIQALEKQIKEKDENIKGVAMLVNIEKEKGTKYLAKIAKMEENINELNKKLKKANCCARNAVTEVDRLRAKECDQCRKTFESKSDVKTQV